MQEHRSGTLSGIGFQVNFRFLTTYILTFWGYKWICMHTYNAELCCPKCDYLIAPVSSGQTKC